ncbi:uncharacterized protein [Euwallacea similis]|uniref:uncharacterized protein n=1 Tax=Euwallacea similis TaxID=1736056 RepID=UPI00344F7386
MLPSLEAETTVNLTAMDFEQLKCVFCKSYLSVPPIHCYVDSKDKMTKSICGRCKLPTSLLVTRNNLYEIVAQCLIFPCSNSNECPEKVHWKKNDHEHFCNFKKIKCHFCESFLTLNDIQQHCEVFHNEQFCVTKPCITLDIKNYITADNRFFLVLNDTKYFIIIRIPNFPLTNLVFGVLPLNKLSTEKRFIVTLNHKDNTFSFIKSINPLIYSWQRWVFNINSIRDAITNITESSTTTEIKIELEIKEDTLDHNKTSIAERTIREISRLLDCPICMTRMKNKIMICSKGHSICMSCQRMTNKCAICRVSPHSHARNLSLEQVSQKLSNQKV